MEVEVRERKKVVKTKKAVYFMIALLTYTNNFDIMKGMMNIKHIKIKISISESQQQVAEEGKEKKREEKKVYNHWKQKYCH